MQIHKGFALIVAAAAVAGLGCSEGLTPPPEEPSVLTLPELIVSDAVAASATTGAASLAVGGGADQTFVSLPPGALPGVVSVRIRNLAGGTTTPAIPVIDGGFDPVPVAAVAGDELELTFTDVEGALSVAHATVPARRPPTVVRTNPPRGRPDVVFSISIRPTVVFSEPIDPETLAAGVRLLTGGTEVNASVALLPDEPWIAELVPASELEPETTYELLVTTEIRDLEGDALEEEVTATFTTESGFVSVQAVLGWQPGSFEYNPYYSYRWWVGDALSGDCRMHECPARRLTVSRISEPTGVVWEIVDTTGNGFDGVFNGNVPPGTVATVADERVGPTSESVLYRVSVTLLDGRVGSAEFDSSDRWADLPASASIAFVSNRDGAFKLYVANPDGSGVRRVTEAAWAGKPAWSRDGRRIAFVREAGSAGPRGIYVINFDGSDLRYVGPGISPTWSPDGRIAFSLSRSHPPSFGLYVMNADGSGVRELLGPSWLCTVTADCDHPQIIFPTWSPDGQTIAFHADIGSGVRGVGVVNADGSDPRLLQEFLDLQVEGFFHGSSGVNTRAAWSPNGSTLAVITGNKWLLATYPYYIHTYDIASGGLELVHTAPGMGVGGAPFDPDWAPDGSRILFSASVHEGDPRGNRRIFTVSLETGEVRQLIPDAIDPVAPGYMDWGAVWSRANR